MKFWKLGLGMVVFTIGIPGLLDDVEQWREWTKNLRWWQGILMGAGGLIILHSLWQWKVREPWQQTKARIRRMFEKPEWLREARDKSDFELWELACLASGYKPLWPLPSDEAERLYKIIASNLPSHILRRISDGKGEELRKVKLTRRQARGCLPYYMQESRRHRAPWFLREEYDRCLPPPRTADEDRTLAENTLKSRTQSKDE